MVYLNGDTVAELMRDALRGADVDPVALEHVVASLLQTSLRGVDSHGINLFPHYYRAVQNGRISRRPEMHIHQTAAGTAILNADNGFGHSAGAIAIDHATTMAADSGIASVAVRNSSHFGAAAYFGLRAAERDCIGLAFTNADALVKAHNSTERFFGTNPICFCAPMADESPFALDMATSLSNWNKVKEASRNGRQIPRDWAFDAQGRPISDPTAAFSLAPSGTYKGFGLGMMVDVLCALLSGGPISKDIPGMYSSSLTEPRHIAHFFVVINIAKFVAIDDFKRGLQEMANRVRALPRTRDADDDIMVAGDREKRTQLVRAAKGIPIDPATFAEYLQISPDFARASVS